MGSKRFTYLVIGQIVLMSVTIFLFWWSLGKENLIISKFLFGCFWLIEVIVLIHFINKTNHSLSIFLDALRASDFVKNMEDGKGTEKLTLSYKQISDIVRKAKLDAESSSAYLRYALENMPIGILSFDDLGNIEIYNSTAQLFFQVSNIENITQIETQTKGFQERIFKLKSGESIILDKTNDDGINQKLLLKVFDFIMQNKKIRLITIQDIRQELDVEELNAWHKLISVMTHEIMNSVGPIKSLSGTLLKMATNFQSSEAFNNKDSHELDDFVAGLKSIKDRSEGMNGFVKSFKEFSRVPMPQKETLNVSEEFRSIQLMIDDLLNENGVRFILNIKPVDLQLVADKNQFFQIIINLINNSINALNEIEDKKIEVKAFRNENSKIEIQFIDNGKGIPEQILDKIFIPFFTTREGGSGIGLSLIKQIMHLHGGTINVKSNFENTIFRLVF